MDKGFPAFSIIVIYVVTIQLGAFKPGDRLNSPSERRGAEFFFEAFFENHSVPGVIARGNKISPLHSELTRR